MFKVEATFVSRSASRYVHLVSKRVMSIYVVCSSLEGLGYIRLDEHVLISAIDLGSSRLPKVSKENILEMGIA